MTNHIHLVARRKEALMSDLLRDFKSYTAKQILKLLKENPEESRKEWLFHLFKYFAKYQKQNAMYKFWQHNNHPIELFSTKVIKQKIEYIHQNPVKAGLVTDAESYVYSSANPLSPLDCINA